MIHKHLFYKRQFYQSNFWLHALFIVTKVTIIKFNLKTTIDFLNLFNNTKPTFFNILNHEHQVFFISVHCYLLTLIGQL